ncbi:MAG: hypothetical protein M3228_04460 [Actinomycetota bacterium]|nr:hypothetical protein [Actinomycetota bacterium]
MSVLTAAVVLAWACLAVLTLAMAGMLRQLRELQAEAAQRGAPQQHAMVGRRVPELAGAGPLLLLVLDPGCSFCDTVHEPFARLAREHPGTRFEVLSPRDRWVGAPGVRSRVDHKLVTELDVPWAPALLHVDSDGTVLAGQPVQSPERLGEQFASLQNTAVHWQGAS